MNLPGYNRLEPKVARKKTLIQFSSKERKQKGEEKKRKKYPVILSQIQTRNINTGSLYNYKK